MLQNIITYPKDKINTIYEKNRKKLEKTLKKPIDKREQKCYTNKAAQKQGVDTSEAESRAKSFPKNF